MKTLTATDATVIPTTSSTASLKVAEKPNTSTYKMTFKESDIHPKVNPVVTTPASGNLNVENELIKTIQAMRETQKVLLNRLEHEEDSSEAVAESEKEIMEFLE